MSVLLPGEVKIASETGVRAGTIGYGGVNDAFNLHLVKPPTNDYKLIIYEASVLTNHHEYGA